MSTGINYSVETCVLSTEDFINGITWSPESDSKFPDPAVMKIFRQYKNQGKGQNHVGDVYHGAFLDVLFEGTIRPDVLRQICNENLVFDSTWEDLLLNIVLTLPTQYISAKKFGSKKQHLLLIRTNLEILLSWMVSAWPSTMLSTETMIARRHSLQLQNKENLCNLGGL